MAVGIGTAFVTRDGTFLDLSQSWTITGWFRQGATLPLGGASRTYLRHLNPAGLGEYIRLGSPANSNALRVEVFDGTDLTVTDSYLPNQGWFWVGVRYDAGSQTVAFFVHGHIVGSFVLDLSLIDFGAAVQSFFNPWGDQGAAYIRIWQRALTFAEQYAESSSAIALLQTDLLADTPLSGPSDLRDRSGEGNDWTLSSGVLDFGAYAFTGEGSNLTVETALHLGTLPVKVTEDVNGAAPADYEVWFQYTPPAGQVAFTVMAYTVAGSNYQPQITIWDNPPGVDPYLFLQADKNTPIVVPCTPGTTYNIKVIDNGGILPFEDLVLLVVNTPQELGPEGSLLVPNDVGGHYAAILLADGTTLQSRAVVAGESGYMQTSGIFALVNDDEDAVLAIVIYTAQIVVIATVSSLLTDTGSSVRVSGDGALTFYVSQWISGVTTALKTLSVAGVVGGTSWTLPAKATAMGVKRNGTICYHSQSGSSGGTNIPVSRYDLVTPGALSDLVAGVVDYQLGVDILVLSDESVLITYKKVTAVEDYFIRQVSAAGALIRDFAFALGGARTDGPRVALDPDDPLSFWTWASFLVSGAHISRMTHFRVSDGVILETFDVPASKDGYMPPGDGNEGDLPLFGPPTSCPFFVLRVDVPPLVSPPPSFFFPPNAVLAPPSDASVTVPKLTMRRLRRSPHINEERIRLFCKRFELDLQRGLGIAPGDIIDGLTQYESPTVMMRVSVDGGITWSSEFHMGAGVVGDYKARPFYVMLGSGDDFVFEITVSDPVIGWYLANAYADFEKGLS